MQLQILASIFFISRKINPISIEITYNYKIPGQNKAINIDVVCCQQMAAPEYQTLLFISKLDCDLQKCETPSRYVKNNFYIEGSSWVYELVTQHQDSKYIGM